MVQENSLKLILYGALIMLTLVGAFGLLGVALFVRDIFRNNHN